MIDPEPLDRSLKHLEWLIDQLRERGSVGSADELRIVLDAFTHLRQQQAQLQSDCERLRIQVNQNAYAAVIRDEELSAAYYDLATLRQQQAQPPALSVRQLAERLVDDYDAQRANDISDETRVQYVASCITDFVRQQAETQQGIALRDRKIVEILAELAETQQTRDRLASDLLDEQHQHHWTRDYLKGAEAQLATLQASLRSLVDQWRGCESYVPGTQERRSWVNAMKSCANDLTALLPPLEARQ